MKQQRLKRIVIATLASVSVCVAQGNSSSDEATLDDKGNVYVMSRDGRHIRMTDTGHCAETIFADDRQTVGCLVAVNEHGQSPGGPPPSLQLEIYLKGGEKKMIEAGAPVYEWHFLEDGRQVAIASGLSKRPQRYALYESATGRLIEVFPAPADESLLPQWAKGRAQIDDESVPMAASLTEERTRWIAKTLRQIEKIEPGMHRRDLAPIFKTEGGMYSRVQRTYVHFDCPFIKVDVRFKAADNKGDPHEESPDDVIESISPPYLAWSVAD